MPYSLESFLIVSAVLFCLGVLTVLTRRNAIVILMGIELIMNAACLNFIAFDRFTRTPGSAEAFSGQVFALFIIAIAAAEVAVALAIVLSLFSHVKSIDIHEFRRLRD